MAMAYTPRLPGRRCRRCQTRPDSDVVHTCECSENSVMGVSQRYHLYTLWALLPKREEVKRSDGITL